MRALVRLVGWVIYLTACLMTVLFVAVPLAYFGAAVALVAGAALAVVLAGIVLLGGPDAPTDLCTPRHVAGGALAGRVDPAFVRRDRAWPQYFAMQVRLDARAFWERSKSAFATLWQAPPEWVQQQQLAALWPLYLAVLAMQVAGSVGLAVGTAVVLLLVAAVAGAAWVAGLALVYLLRAIDAGLRVAIGAEASCQTCFAVARIPAYRCLGPHSTADRMAGDDLHRDLRPGRLGVLWRRCACGTTQPTTVLRAAWSRRLQACCPTCARPLPHGSAALTDVRIPVFGAASSGKTQLIMAVLVTLRRLTTARRVRLSWPDERSEQTYRDYALVVEQDLPAPKTSAARPPAAVTVRLDKGRHRALLHLFDAAGELLVDRKENAHLSYLDHAGSLVFVLDPFSIRTVRDTYGGEFPELFAEANPAVHDPEDSYQATATRLQTYGVRTTGKPLAFVVTKADLLEKLSIGPATPTSSAVRGWLADQGLDNLVLAAERDFREVRYFLVSGKSLDVDGAFAPVDWLMTKEWISLA
jgi:hypothetical protein